MRVVALMSIVLTMTMGCTWLDDRARSQSHPVQTTGPKSETHGRENGHMSKRVNEQMSKEAKKQEVELTLARGFSIRLSLGWPVM